MMNLDWNAIEHNDYGQCGSNDFFPIFCQKGKDQRLLHLKNDGEEHEVENYENQQAVMATGQDIADCFKLGKSINQYKNLCFLSYKMQCEPEYSRIDEIETDSSDDEEDVVELHLSSEDHEFYRDKSTAKKIIHKKWKKPLLNKHLDVEQFPHVDVKDLLQKLSDYSKITHLDTTTLVAEQINDPVLQVVRTWVRNKNKPNTKTPEIQQLKAYRISIIFINIFSIKKAIYTAITNLFMERTNAKWKFVSPYHYSYPSLT